MAGFWRPKRETQRRAVRNADYARHGLAKILKLLAQKKTDEISRQTRRYRMSDLGWGLVQALGISAVLWGVIIVVCRAAIGAL